MLYMLNAFQNTEGIFLICGVNQYQRQLRLICGGKGPVNAYALNPVPGFPKTRRIGKAQKHTATDR